MATKPITELDFDQLKSSIVDFIKTNPTFSDYNFEGSALNALIDVLAFNTHTNAYYANMQHNEGFLDTAQKRSSVVSRSKELGYMPRSCVCSQAYVNINVVGIPTNTSVSIPRGTVFNSKNDNGNYQFIVADTVSTNVVGTSRLFTSVKLVNGKNVKNTFTVDPNTNIRSIFTIPNKNIDTSTLKVFVRASSGAIEKTEYFLATNAYELTSNSNVYFLQESYNGNYQIYFGNGVIGIEPSIGNVIDVDYVVTDNFSDADGCRIFTFNGTIGSATNITITTTQLSFGGSDKESLESIKYNATKSNSARERSVTVNDYELMLKKEFNFIKSVSVWGGEDNVPPVYGKVFISIQPLGGYAVSTAVKKDLIAPVIRKTSLLTILPEFVDPTYTNLEFTTKIKFNSSKTTSTQIDIESTIKDVVRDYIDSISTFNVDYLESTLQNKILDIDTGIVSVAIDKRIGFKMTPIIGVVSNHNRTLNNAIEVGTIKSTKFVAYYDGAKTVVIREIPDTYVKVLNADGTINLVVSLGLYENNTLIKDIGTVNLDTGEFNISYYLYAYISSTRSVSITCDTISKDIVVKRNQILNLDISGEDSSIGLLDNNVVMTELYVK